MIYAHAMNAGRHTDRRIEPLLTESQLQEMKEFGQERPAAAGDLLFEAGEASFDLFVVLEGEAEVVRVDGAQDVVVATFGPGEFIGELTLLTGQRRFLTGRVSRAGRVLAIEQAEFRRLMSVRPAIADIIFGVLVSRREFLRSGQGAQAIRIIGSRYSPEAMSLRSFAEHSRLAHTWIDLEDAEDVEALLANAGLRPQDTPVVITPTGTLHHASAASLARTPRSHVPAQTRVHLRSRRRRQRTRRPGRRRIRRIRGPQHGLPRRRHRRRAGRRELAHRELRGLPQRHLRRRSHLQGSRAGAATRRATERAVRGRRAARRGQLPRRQAQRRQRDPRRAR